MVLSVVWQRALVACNLARDLCGPRGGHYDPRLNRGTLRPDRSPFGLRIGVLGARGSSDEIHKQWSMVSNGFHGVLSVL